MTKLNYATMSDQELKDYLLVHRDDTEAFHAYMDRRSSRPSRVRIDSDDPLWEEKIVSIIQTQLDKSN